MDEVINQTSMWVVRSSHWPGLSSLGHCRTNPHNQARSKSWSKASRARSGCRMVRSSFLKLLWGYKISINGQDMGWSPGKKLRADGENECASWQLVELWHNPLLQHHDCQRDNRPEYNTPFSFLYMLLNQRVLYPYNRLPKIHQSRPWS